MIRSTSQQDRVIERKPTLIRRYRLPVAIAAIVLVVAVLANYLMKFAGAGRSVDRSQLTIATVERGSFTRDVAADGQVVAARSPMLYASAPGSVTLQIHAGDAVTKGQVLATIDSPDLTAKLSQEDATLETQRIDWQRAKLDAANKLSQLREALAEADVDQKTAQRELERNRKAYELGAYPELQVLKAEDALEKAKFADQQARLNFQNQPKQGQFDVDSKKALYDRQQYLVADLKRQIAALEVVSPVDGNVGQVVIADRATVAKDAQLMTVVDLSTLEVEIKVPESFARDLAPGMEADLEGSGHHWKGSVSGVSPEVVNGEVVTRLRFLDDKPEGLRQNQRLSVRIFLDRRENVLMVDRGAFMDQDGGNFAYVVHDNIAERHAVRLGAASTRKVEVLDGLAAGDQIVISGTDAFRDAQRVILSR